MCHVTKLHFRQLSLMTTYTFNLFHVWAIWRSGLSAFGLLHERLPTRGLQRSDFTPRGLS